MIPIIAEKTGADPEAIQKQASICDIPLPGGERLLIRFSASSMPLLLWGIMESLQTLQAWYHTLLLPSHTSSQVRLVIHYLLQHNIISDKFR
jgi:hypothetical protein